MDIDDDYSENGESDSDYDSDDPSYGIVEDVRSEFSKLSIKMRGKLQVLEDSDSSDEGGAVEAEITVPELGEKDQKSLEVVLKLIEDGKVDKLKVDQCKVYLRKNGLRLTGNKETLIQRIKEHLEIINGGEQKYPRSSFFINCKGDACIGDVVMFQQNVYDQFNLVSRSASGPPVGKRVVAGRIIKESYGAAKQQHTFTLEVLWSKGEKALPPLHPLLIKGRNLYRFNTMRQRWEDEAERERILTEKHSRGSLARSDREARIREKEERKALKGKRLVKKNHTDGAPKSGPFNNNPRKPTVAPPALGFVGDVVQSASHHEHPAIVLHPRGGQNPHHPAVWEDPRIAQSFYGRNVIPHHIYAGSSAVCNPRKPTVAPPALGFVGDVVQSASHHEHPAGSSAVYSRPDNFHETGNRVGVLAKDRHPLGNVNQQYLRTRTQGHGDGRKRQLCPYFDKGRCHFGDNCKFLHEYRVHMQNRQEAPNVQRYFN